MSEHSILFLDLARRFGHAEGVPGQRPYVGHGEFAPSGGKPQETFKGAIKWLGTRLQAFRPRTIVYEAFLDPRFMGGKTNLDTSFVLIGLCAVVEGVAATMGVHDIRKASVGDIRFHLLGKRPKAAEGKKLVQDRLRALGYEIDSPDAADALAGWIYAADLIAPQYAAASTPLFGRAAE